MQVDVVTFLSLNFANDLLWFNDRPDVPYITHGPQGAEVGCSSAERPAKGWIERSQVATLVIQSQLKQTPWGSPPLVCIIRNVNADEFFLLFTIDAARINRFGFVMLVECKTIVCMLLSITGRQKFSEYVKHPRGLSFIAYVFFFIGDTVGAYTKCMLHTVWYCWD